MTTQVAPRQQTTRTVTRPSRATIVAAGESVEILPDSGGVLSIHSGMLKMVATRADGRHSILRLCFQGEVIPFRVGPYTLDPWAISFIAVSDSTVTLLEGSQVGALLSDTAAARALLGAFAGEIRISHERSTRQKLLEGTQRAAATLCSLAERLGEPCPEGVVVEFPLTQAELAEVTGLARETFSRALRSFILRGWLLADRGSFIITNESALRSHAGFGP